MGKPTEFEYPMGRRSRAPGTGQVTKVTDRGIAKLAEIVAMVRETVGWDVALCIDHYGHGFLTAKEVIKLGKALEPYGLAWMEDPMPWADVEGHKRVTDAVGVPIAAGENLYLWDGFQPFIEQRAIDIPHPDLLTSGGMLETKKIADYAERFGMPTALHFAGSPIAFMANLHTRGRDLQLCRPGAPRAGPALLERPGDGPGRPADGRWVRQGARQARPGRRSELGGHRRRSAPVQRPL